MYPEANNYVIVTWFFTALTIQLVQLAIIPFLVAEYVNNVRLTLPPSQGHRNVIALRTTVQLVHLTPLLRMAQMNVLVCLIITEPASKVYLIHAQVRTLCNVPRVQ